MVDNKAAAKIDADQLQQLQQGYGGDPGTLLLLLPEGSDDPWDTAGMRMSALCLNVLQDISDAASKYSSEDRSLVRRKTESTQRKSFVDFFRIKKKSKSKKWTESTDNDSPEAKQLQNAQNAATALPTTDNGSAAEERRRNGSGHEKEFSFGAIDDSGRSATLPSNGKENASISKDKRGKTEKAKSRKLTKAKGSAVAAAAVDGQRPEKGRRLIWPLKHFEARIQKVVSNVNNKFPATEDSANERSSKANGLNTSTAEPTEATVGTTDEKRLSNGKNNNEEEVRDKKTQETTGNGNHAVSEGQRQKATDAQNAPDPPTAVRRESPRTVSGRGRARDRGDQLRRGRSEEALSSKGQVKRIRRRALSREWVVVKTTTTQCTTTLSATSKNSGLRRSPSNESAMTSQQGSNDDVICQPNGRRHEGLLGSERNRENESISRPQRYSRGDRPISDFNNNSFLQFPSAGDVSGILPPVLSKQRIELGQTNSPADTSHPNSAPEKMSVDPNSLQMSHNDPLRENSDSPQQLMKSVDASLIISRLLPQSDPFSLDDEESAKDFSEPNSSDAPDASAAANQSTRALEVSSDAGRTLPLADCQFHSTLDSNDTTEARQTQESHLRTEIQQLPLTQSADIEAIQAFDDRTENPQKEEGVGRKLSGNNETVTSGSTKSRWTKRKSAVRSRTVEKSPAEEDGNSSDGQTTNDLPGLLQSIETRDWQENSIHATTAALSPRLSKPRWTKRKSTARGNRQPGSSLLSTNSHPNAVQPFHSNAVYGCAGDGQLCIGAGPPQNGATGNNDCFGKNNSVACKPRWTKRQLTVRGTSRALVGMNFGPSYETKAGASPSNNRTPKQSPRLRRGRQRQEDSSDSSCLNPPVEDLRRNPPTFSTDDSILSKTAKRRTLITDATPESRDIDDATTFSTDAPSFLESTPEESSTRRNRRWEDVDRQPAAEPIRPTDDCSGAVDACTEGSDRRQRPADDGHPMTAEDNEATRQDSSVCKIPIEVECSADSEIEFECCEDGLDEEDLDITPTNDLLLFYSNDDDQGSSDCETISDRNESKTHDYRQEDDETSSCFDGSQDGVDSAYFADIDANERSAHHSPMTGLNSDTDPETTDHGTASDDRDCWTTSSANGSPFLENKIPNETTSVCESSIHSLENHKRRREDATNEENMTAANEMPGCASDHRKESGESGGDAATWSAFGQRHSVADDDPDQSSAAAATEAQLKKTDEEMSSAESANAEHPKSCRKEVDVKSSWSCGQTAMEKDTWRAKHFNKDSAQRKDTEEKQRSSDESSVIMQHPESTAAEFVDCNAEGALDSKEFSEDERVPTAAASDSNSARRMSDSIQLMTEGNMTETNHHQPKTDKEEETDRDSKETERERYREGKETERARKRDEERRPKFYVVDRRRPQLQPRTTRDSRSSTGPAHRMSTDRWRVQSEEDGSTHLLSLQQQQQQHRLLHIDVPYSDSGYSETEADTLSPCSFRSSLSRADTVTEEGGPPLDDDDDDSPLTDDDGDGAGLALSICSGHSGDSLATIFAIRPSRSALEGGGGGAIDSAADEVFSPNTKTDYVSSAAAASVSSSGRSEWKWEERREEEEEESGKGSSLLSFASYDSGIGSSTVNKDSFEFPSTNLNDETVGGWPGRASSCAEDKQRLFGENRESSKATAPDSSEVQPTVHLAISKDVNRYKDSKVNAFSQSPDRHDAHRKDISAVSQQVDRDSLCRLLQQNIQIKGTYSREIEMPVDDEKDRELVTRCRDSGFMQRQPQTVNRAIEVITGRSKEEPFCAATETEFNGDDDQNKQINQSQILPRNVDSEVDRSPALINDISVYSKHSTKNESSLESKGDQSFHERENTVVDIDRSESDIACQRPLYSESAAGNKRESCVYSGVCGQQKPFQGVSCAINEDQTAAIDATEVPLRAQPVKTKTESETYNRINQHEASSFTSVDSLGNYDERQISRYLDEGDEENNWTNYEVRRFHSEYATEILTVRHISIDSPKNEERQESANKVEKEESASKRNDTSTSLVCDRAAAAAAAAAAAEGEAVTQENNSPLRSVAGDSSLNEELDKERQVLTWHENAEMFSVYDYVDGAEWPRPSAWIWNRSPRYTNIHRLSVNGDGFFRYPDPMPCQSLNWPLPFVTLCLVRGRQEASSADEHQVKESVNHPSFQCTENELRSSAEKRQTRSTCASSDDDDAIRESERKTMGGSDNKDPEPSAIGEAKDLKTLNQEDRCKRESARLNDASDDSRCCAQQKNRLQLSSIFTTDFNENDKIKRNIQRQNNKSETEMETLEFLCSVNDSEFDEDDGVEAATVDCIRSTETSSGDGNQSVGEMEGGGDETPFLLQEEGGDGPERVVSAEDRRSFSSSLGPKADRPSSQHDEQRPTAEEWNSRQTPPRVVVESVGAVTGDSEDSAVNGRTQRSRMTNEDEDTAVTSVFTDDDETNSEDSNESTRHHINTNNSTLTYFLASTAGFLSIILLILISVRQTESTEVNSSKTHP